MASLTPSVGRASTLEFDPDFLDRYRRKWTWDYVVRSTHNVNCWFQQSCCFYVYARDGQVIREEQVGDYPQTHPGVPDFNPRGCQKGCCYSSLMYGEARVTAPLKRTGPRGEEGWEEISWDQALTEIAEKVVTAVVADPQTIVVDPGTGVSQLSMASFLHLSDVLDSVWLDINCELGDDQQGAAVTYGEVASDRSSDDYFNADLILIWGGNPAYTQIPNFHFLTEARYNGTRVVAISPDLNASAIHADQWVPLKPGTDAALALGMAHVVITQGLYDAALIREQTDLPLLVRTHDRKILRQTHLSPGGAPLATYCWDTRRDRLTEVNTRSLELGDLVPALEGQWEIETPDGPVTVTTVFELLKQEVEKFTPEHASELCGVAPATIRQLAMMLVESDAATNVCTSALSKYYHGDLMMRAQILIFVLTGHLGRPGDGFVSASFLLADGVGADYQKLLKVRDIRWRMMNRYGYTYWGRRYAGMDEHRADLRFLQDTYVESRMGINSTLFWYRHAGLDAISGRAWDPDLPRDVGAYLQEALDKGWQADDPTPEPRVLFVGMGNPLRRVRAAHKLTEVLWPKLDLVVVFDLRMSSTARMADYVLPVSGAYEKTTTLALNSNTCIPYLHTTRQVVSEVGESRNEWEIVSALVKKIEQVAIARGTTTFTGRFGHTRRLDNLSKSLARRIAEPDDAEALSRQVVRDSSNLGGASWRELKREGYVRFTKLGRQPSNWGNATDIHRGETIYPHAWHTEKKKPWATLSGRVQFYHDHDWYLELSEALPTHKAPPPAGGDLPLTMTGGHTRWSIHATWRSDPTLLRLQRGEPCMWVSVEDAAARGIKDADRIRVFNDIGAFITHAKVSPAVQPGQVVMYHAWENYQFEGGVGYRNVQASPLNPIELVGDHPWFEPMAAIRQPGQSDRDTRVDIEVLP